MQDPIGATGGEAVYVASFDTLRMTDVESVGGKNASLGEMISQLAGAGVRVPAALPPRLRRFATFSITPSMAALRSATVSLAASKA
jgi:pyruvate,water dikinase